MGSNPQLQQRIDELAVHYVDRMGEMGGECDFVKDVAICSATRHHVDIRCAGRRRAVNAETHPGVIGSTDPDGLGRLT